MSTTTFDVISTAAWPKVTSRSWITSACLLCSDTVAALMTMALMMLFVRAWPDLWKEFILAQSSMLLVFGWLGLYPGCGFSPARELREILAGSALSHGVAAGALLIRHGGEWWFGAGAIFAWGATVILVISCRAVARHACSNKAWWGVPAVIFGSGRTAQAVLRHLRAHPSTGLRVVAIFEDDRLAWPVLYARDVPITERIHAADFARNNGVSHAIVALPDARCGDIRNLIRGDARFFKHLLVIPDLSGLSSLWVGTRDIGGMLGLHISQNLLHRGPQILKRAVDLVLAGVTAVIFLPVIALVMLAIRLTSPGPIVYGQVRVGRDDTRFIAWKFRSMCANADEVLKKHLESDPELKREWERDQKLRNDPRVTPVGRFIRKTSLDELPQLWNVLKGEMSLVGPRPIVAAEIARYGDSFDLYKKVRPGVSGMWQVSGRNNTSYGERVEFDEYYVNNWSIWLDLYIIGRTIKTVLLREGAY